MESKEKRP
jgi:small GTP-binding protein